MCQGVGEKRILLQKTRGKSYRNDTRWTFHADRKKREETHFTFVLALFKRILIAQSEIMVKPSL